jgi:hypothetical protein
MWTAQIRRRRRQMNPLPGSSGADALNAIDMFITVAFTYQPSSLTFPPSSQHSTAINVRSVRSDRAVAKPCTRHAPASRHIPAVNHVPLMHPMPPPPSVLQFGPARAAANHVLGDVTRPARQGRAGM